MMIEIINWSDLAFLLSAKENEKILRYMGMFNIDPFLNHATISASSLVRQLWDYCQSFKEVPPQLSKKLDPITDFLVEQARKPHSPFIDMSH